MTVDAPRLTRVDHIAVVHGQDQVTVVVDLGGRNAHPRGAILTRHTILAWLSVRARLTGRTGRTARRTGIDRLSIGQRHDQIAVSVHLGVVDTHATVLSVDAPRSTGVDRLAVTQADDEIPVVVDGRIAHAHAGRARFAGLTVSPRLTGRTGCTSGGSGVDRLTIGERHDQIAVGVHLGVVHAHATVLTVDAARTSGVDGLPVAQGNDKVPLVVDGCIPDAYARRTRLTWETGNARRAPCKTRVDRLTVGQGHHQVTVGVHFGVFDAHAAVLTV